MAEYYPLLAKAVSGLPMQTPEARRSVYDRARKALLGQLNAMQPPIPKVDIDREASALDAAIEQLEAELDPLSKAIAEAVASVSTPVTAEMAESEAAPSAPAEPPRFSPRPPESDSVRFEVPQSNLPKIESFAPSAPVDFDEFDPPGSAKPRPVAPQMASEEAGSWRLWLVGAVVAVIVAGVALTAFEWRDRPEDLAKLKPVAAPPAVESSGKISGRATGSTSAAQNPPVTQVPTVAVPTVPVRPVPGQGDEAANPNTPILPVAQRAALLVEAPDEPEKTKTYVGTVVWRLESLSKGEGQPLATVVRADIDIPDAKLKTSMVLQKNLDPTLPATHTIELRFMPAAASDIGAIQEISTPQIRSEGMPSGEQLVGVPVQIAQNWFLVGLSQSETDRNHNADLLNKNAWVDVQMLLANKRLAKITFEKGPPGEKTIGDAFAAWQ
jgi:hypothetical protein